VTSFLMMRLQWFHAAAAASSPTDLSVRRRSAATAKELSRNLAPARRAVRLKRPGLSQAVLDERDQP